MINESKHAQTLSWSKDGKAHIPLAVRKELGCFDGEGEVYIFANSNIVLLFRKDVSKEDIMRSIKLMRDTLLLKLETTEVLEHV